MRDAQSRVGPPPTIVYETFREFIYGLDSIDEQIAMISPLEPQYGEWTDWIMQDANQNVVGVRYSWYPNGPAEPEEYGRHFTFRYHPYGRWTKYLYGYSLVDVDWTSNDNRLWYTHGGHGLMVDQETGLIYNRHRYRDGLDRFMSPDPNGQALALATALLMNAQTPIVFADSSPMTQYDDTMNLYEGWASNPNTNQDPTGLSLLEAGWQNALANWSDYLETYQGRAWTNRIEGIADASSIFGSSISAFDQDVFEAVDALQTHRVTTLQDLEEASVKIRHGHKLSNFYTQWAQEWDQVVWERDEAILFSLVTGGFFARACFEAGTTVLLADGASHQPIEAVQLGTRVASWPAEPDWEVSDAAIDPDSWRAVRLEADDPQRGRVAIALLRPRGWVHANDAEPGNDIWLSIPDMDVHGHAVVQVVEPCPKSAAGPLAGMVTGTFATEHAETVSVYLDGLDNPIGATPSHPFYSVERAAWTPAGDLAVGEHVRTTNGYAAVTAIEQSGVEQPVYNLEVQGTHTYFVCTAKAWVHNGCQVVIPRGTKPKDIPGPWPAAISRSGKVYVAKFHSAAVELAMEGGATRAGIKMGEVVLDELGNAIKILKMTTLRY